MVTGESDRTDRLLEEVHAALDRAPNGRAAVFAVYFGELPKHFRLWASTASRSDLLTWVLLTDNPHPYTTPGVQFVDTSLSEFRHFAEDRLGTKIGLTRPYKVCDLKPFFGQIFDVSATGFGHWGYADLDVVWGDVDAFLSEPLRRSYWKIFRRGHLSLIRSDVDVPAKLAAAMGGEEAVRASLAAEGNRVLDEGGGLYHAQARDLNVWLGETIFDIDPSRLELVARTSTVRHPTYCIHEGRALEFGPDGRVSDEGAYIHFSKRVLGMPAAADTRGNFRLEPAGFVACDGDHRSLRAGATARLDYRTQVTRARVLRATRARFGRSTRS